jgi:lipoprotein-anchoring transpeptidase ErfK/SrfK
MKATALAILVTAIFAGGSALAQGARGAAPPPTPMKKASELLKKQDAPVINKELADVINQDNSSVVISLAKQRAYLMVGDKVYIDTPISSGKRVGMTPTGDFKVMQKDPNHRSSVYGNYVDRSGRVVRAGISVRVDSAPSGTHYEGAPMKWFCRLTDTGVGMHVGILPGYPASHGCIRMPEAIAPLIYQKVKIGTPVSVRAE